MDSGFVKSGLDFTKRKKRWIIFLGLVGFSSYGAYRVYHMPSVARKRERVLKLFGALASVAEIISDSSETLNVVSRDLKEFLNSDSDEIPNTLKQLSKIARCEEFSESVARVCQAMTVGVLRGYKVDNDTSKIQGSESSGFPDKVMGVLFSSAGTGFASTVVGSFARNLVLGYYENVGPSGDEDEDDQSKPKMWLNLVLDDRCRVLIADCIKNFVSTAVTVYLEKTMDVNFYEEMFSGMTNPKHQNKVTDFFVTLCNGAVGTLVKTSHQVLTSSEQGSTSRSKEGLDFKPKPRLGKDTDRDFEESGWVSSVSSTLAVPSNKKFVLDVTGRVTFETVRSVVELVMQKLWEGLKRSGEVVHEEVVERGFEVVRYVGYKSSVILTLCLALFLHVIGNTYEMLPA